MKSIFRMRFGWALMCSCACLALFILAAGAATSSRVPPPGKAIPEEARKELTRSVADLEKEIVALRKQWAGQPDWANRIADVEIFHKAVDWPLRYNEFYGSNDVAIARRLLKQGFERAKQLQAGEAPWLTATGLVVRGYVSRLDGSVQPYGLVIPADFDKEQNKPRRFDVWLHGRDNHLTELKFLAERQRSRGEFAPADAIVLHPYGRYCNAFKFVGEVDVFEAMEAVSRDFAVDTNRIALRGFSMGGAGVWHLAAHHPDRWAVAAPGAGFAETAEYTKALSRQPHPPAWEQTLWGLYDATAYARNFANLPVIAYNGTEDPQRQAADAMERAMNAANLPLPRVWGTNTGHKYTAEARQEINAFVDAALERRRTALPDKVQFTTRTLRYHRAPGLEVLGLDQHWSEARVQLQRSALSVTTTNVNAFALELAGEKRFDVDDQTVELPRASHAVFRRDAKGRWSAQPTLKQKELRKEPGLQGPIDDAFMEPFVMVRPTGKPGHPSSAAWTGAALEKATNEWRAQFRGHVRVIDDTEVTDEIISRHHLVLWGDPQSNRLLARIIKKLPVRWDTRKIRLGEHEFPSNGHVVAMIYPNPLNPRRYVVLNSGFTFAAAGAGSNAQQTPKLPDYAVLPTTAQEGPVQAGFFDEAWKIPAKQ